MNISKQNEDDGISMYLSFDNTTQSDSTSTYKTIACDDLTSFSDFIDSEDSKGNTTLHNTDKVEELSGCISLGMETVAQPLKFPYLLREFQAVSSSTPSKIEVPSKSMHDAKQRDQSSGIMEDCMSVVTGIVSQPSMVPNVLSEFNRVSLTPSKVVSPMKARSSPAKDLFEFSRKSSERGPSDLSVVFNNLVSEYEQENKENPQPSSSDDSMPSFSQSSILQLEKLKRNLPPPPHPPQPKQEESAIKVDIESVLESLREYNILSPTKRHLNSPRVGIIESIKEYNVLSPTKRQLKPSKEMTMESIKDYDKMLFSLKQKGMTTESIRDYDKIPLVSPSKHKGMTTESIRDYDKMPLVSSLKHKGMKMESVSPPKHKGMKMESIKDYDKVSLVSPPKHKGMTMESVKDYDKVPLVSPPKYKISPRKFKDIDSVLDSLEVFNILPSAKMNLLQSKIGTESTLESIKEYSEPTKAVLRLIGDKKVKMNSAGRKTLCEPNLLINRPSRIAADKKTRFSTAMNDQNIGDSVFRHAPPALNRKASTSSSMSVSSSTLITANKKAYKIKTAGDEESNQKTAAFVRNSMTTGKATGVGRKSIAANLQNDKRPTPKRMPPIAKTTLNYATRKSLRSSLSIHGTAMPKRRSVLLLPPRMMSPLKRKLTTPTDMSSKEKYAARTTNDANTETDRFSPKKQNVNMRKSLYAEKVDANKFVCNECGASYRVKSSLDAHKKTHRPPSPHELLAKQSRALGGSASNNGVAASAPVNNQCKYCDKNFVLERALHIHLMEHCPKIPASERRKLNFTEMDHVRKEETPHFRAPPPARPLLKPPPTLSTKDPLSHLPVRKPTEMSKIQQNARSAAGDDKKNYNEARHSLQNSSPSRQAANKQAQMAPPHSTKVKKRSAHTGVYRTPNKDILCVTCKQSFKNVIDYTNHMMATHAALDASMNSLGGNAE